MSESVSEPLMKAGFLLRKNREILAAAKVITEEDTRTRLDLFLEFHKIVLKQANGCDDMFPARSPEGNNLHLDSYDFSVLDGSFSNVEKLQLEGSRSKACFVQKMVRDGIGVALRRESLVFRTKSPSLLAYLKLRDVGCFVSVFLTSRCLDGRKGIAEPLVVFVYFDIKTLQWGNAGEDGVGQRLVKSRPIKAVEDADGRSEFISCNLDLTRLQRFSERSPSSFCQLQELAKITNELVVKASRRMLPKTWFTQELWVMRKQNLRLRRRSQRAKEDHIRAERKALFLSHRVVYKRTINAIKDEKFRQMCRSRSLILGEHQVTGTAATGTPL